jgi:NAD(P)-dependent dehydrogenase (short-subunit alcohol dehydrogenase family)
MRHKFDGKVIVITGGSSGIGRATAHEFAKQGASLVLIGRSEDALRQAASECERHGADVLTVTADVTDEAAIASAALRAVERFGKVDIWINNAGVLMLARFEDAPSDVYRKVIETNLFGYINGARAILPHFRSRGEGVLINVASQAALSSLPYSSAYVASKYAVRGWTHSLRQELAGSGIHACCVLPTAIDTPIFQHGANYTGRAAKSMGKALPIEDAVHALLDVAAHPRREVLVGKGGYAMGFLRGVAPRLYETLERRKAETHFQDKPAAPSPGNVFHSLPDSVTGGWVEPASGGKSVSLAVGAAAAACAGLAWYVARNRSASRSDARPVQ